MRARRVVRRWLLVVALAAIVAGALGGPGARAQSATLVVTSAASSGDGVCDATCTLRDAIIAANAGSGPSRIVFNIGSAAGNGSGSGPAVIRLDASLPPVTARGTAIDGRTQPGYDGAPLIYLEGGAAGEGSGLVSRAADVEFRALAAGGFAHFGFLVIGEGADNNRLLGNWAGLSPDGAASNPNALSGIAVVAGPDGALIGDLCVGCGNRVAGNSVEGRTGHGILVGGAGTTGARVLGNVVGLGRGGLPLPNDDGILIVDGAHATIGGDGAGAGNVVGASRVAGIELRGTASLLPVRLEGNRIGLDEAGLPAPNDVGIFVNGASGPIEIGAARPGTANIVSANRVGIAVEDRAHGVRVLGNRIGLTPRGDPAPNTEGGVSVIGGSRDIEIGGGGTGEGNRIVGGRTGVTIAELATRGVHVLGNHLRGSAVGVRVSGGLRITIGREGEGRGNVVVGQTQVGILLEDVAQVTVAGNWIGLTRDGAPAGNAVGLLLRDRRGEGAHDNVVRGNRIGGNIGAGIVVLGDKSVRNAVHENVFQPNGGLGIDLGGDGPTANDRNDRDSGPNQLLNAPVIDAVAHDGVQAEVRGQAGRRHRVALYRVGSDAQPSLLPHASGHGPGVELIAVARAGADGAWTITHALAAGAVLTAVAVDPFGNTSEFGANFASDPPPLLRAGFTAAAWLGPDLPVTEALASLGDRVQAVFRFDAPAQEWAAYRPGLAAFSDLDVLHPRDVLWLVLSPGPDVLWVQPDAPPADGPTDVAPLEAGLNFVRWSGGSIGVGDGMASIEDVLQSAFRWDPRAHRYETVFPRLPGAASAPLQRGDVLWLRLSAPADWPQLR